VQLYGACPLGHVKLETTAIYARVSPKLLNESHHPLDALPTVTSKRPKRKPKKAAAPA